MKSLTSFTLFLLTCFIFTESFGVSNDSPDLSLKSENDLTWSEWINKTKEKLKFHNFKDSTLNQLDKITFNKRVIELDRKQPEFKINFNQYKKNLITKERKKQLKKNYIQNLNLLKKIESNYNIDIKTLVSLWAIETSFGKHVGKFNIIRSLCSLSYDGRRKDFFFNELVNAMTIIDDEHIKVKDFKGSWAGAFGQTQFMPSTFINYAVDFDNDKKINLFNKQDALASGANYLSLMGWNNKLIWGEKIDIKLDEKLKKFSKEKTYKKRKYWESYGIFLKKKYNDDDLMRLIIPDSIDNQVYLVTKNFDVLLGWNRSNYFALTVFLLSDEIN